LSSRSCLTSRSECLRQGPFAPRALPRFVALTGPSARLPPSPRFASRLARLPCFRGFSPRGGEPFPASTHGLVRVLPSFTPPGERSRRSLSRVSAAFAGFLMARPPGCVSRGLVRTFTRRCGPRTRSPRQAGLCRWASPSRSPVPAPPQLCGFDLLPLQDFHLTGPWVPPGITEIDAVRCGAMARSSPESPRRGSSSS